MYKDLQGQAVASISPIELLQEQLSQLKAKILDKYLLEKHKEYQKLHNQFREVELIETNRLRRLSRVKGLGAGDNTKKTFYKILKEK